MQFRQIENDVFLGDFHGTLSELQAQAPAFPGLPEGMVSRLYDPEAGRHVLHSPDTQYPGPQPWPEGDTLLAEATNIQAAIEATRPQPAPAPLADPSVISTLAFKRRITSAEWGRIDDLIAAGGEAGKALRDFERDLFASTEVNLADPNVQDALAFALTLGVFTDPVRVDDILHYEGRP